MLISFGAKHLQDFPLPLIEYSIKINQFLFLSEPQQQCFEQKTKNCKQKYKRLRLSAIVRREVKAKNLPEFHDQTDI